MSHQELNDNHEDISSPTEVSSFSSNNGLAAIIAVVAIVILASGVFAYQFLVENKVEAKKAEVSAYTPTVEVEQVTRVNFVPTIALQGEVMPATQTTIISEVTGPVVDLSSNLEVGKTLRAGEFILRINDADYRTQLASAQATLADAELVLAQENARAEQSIRDWKKLGKGRPASALVRRIPQIKSAKARIDAAQAAIEKATRDIEKTVIRAPYHCMVDQKFIDYGAYLSTMGKIATIYSVADYEVRLPVSLDKLNFLPENNGIGADVNFYAKIGGATLRWTGKVDRFEGGIDTKTFSMIMVVTIKPSDKQGIFEYPPKGLFIDGEINGRTINDVIKIPRVALREGQRIWILSDSNKLRIAEATIIREEKDHIYIQANLKAGAKVIISPIAVPVEGMTLDRAQPKSEEKAEPAQT